MSKFRQLEFPFPSLDFPGRHMLYPHEVAEKLSIDRKHLMNLVEENEIQAIDISGRHGAPKKAAQSRRYLRFPIESWRDFILRRLTGPVQRDMLRTLPPHTLRELHREILEILSEQSLSNPKSAIQNPK